MASVPHYFLLVLVALGSQASQPSCWPGCTCSEQDFGRSLQCTSISLGKLPGNLPEEFKQVRIERSPLFELPQGSFVNMSTLEYLWLNFDSVSVIHPGALERLPGLKELRLEGNQLRSVPWTAFRATPLLRVMDLRHNRIDALPERALQFLASLTYLDLSSNRLTVVSERVFLNWPAYQTRPRPGREANLLSSLVLALHNNPWSCDCRLRGLVQLLKSVRLSVILVDPYLMCLGPLPKAGQLVHETELGACVKPQVSTPSANVTVQVGHNATLQCLAQASPSPTITWTYPPGTRREFDVLTASATEEAAESQLLIPDAHLVDRGNYTCAASNSLGRATTVISLHVQLLPVLPAPRSRSLPAGGSSSVPLRVARQTVHGVLLEWGTVADTSEEKWFTLHVASEAALRKEQVVHLGPGIRTYALDDLLPGTKYEACLSLGGQPPQRGRCVVFVTGRAHGGLGDRERLLHVSVVLCAVLLAVPVGAYVWAARGPCSCGQWGPRCCPPGRRAPRCPQAASLHKDDSCGDPSAVCEDGQGSGDTGEGEEKERHGASG